MNKIILTITILLTSNLYSFSQTIIPLAGFQGQIIGAPTESNDTITALLLINDFSNNFTGLDLSSSMNLVIWKNCQRYEVTELVSVFANEVTIKLYKGGNNTLHRGVCALLEENESLISHLISGITDSDKQCIDSYYRNIVSSGGNQLTEAEVDAYADNNGYLEVEVDGSITNEIQDISLSGTDLSISSGSTIDLSSIDTDTNTQLTEAQVDAFANNNGYLLTEVDGSVTNELQTISKTGSTVTLSDGGGSFTDTDTNTQLTEAQVDAFADNNGYLEVEVDGSVTNEIQNFDVTNLTGTTLQLSLTQDATTYTIDLSSLNNSGTDSQDLTLSGNTLAISNDPNTDVDLSAYLDDTDTQLTEAQVDAFADNNGYLETEVDGSITNELQTLTDNGATFSLSNSGGTVTKTVDTNTQLTEAQVDAFADNNGYNEVIGTDSDINTSGSYVVDQIYMTDGVVTSHSTRQLFQLEAEDDRDLAPEDIAYSEDVKTYFTSKNGLDTGSSTNSDYQDAIVFNTWTDGSGGDANLLSFDKSEKKIYHYQADQAATNWGTPEVLAYVSDIPASGGKFVDGTDTDDAVYTTGNVGIGVTNPTSELHVSGNADISGSLFLGPQITARAATTQGSILTLGQDRTGNGYSYIDLVGDATYSDYGLRIIRNNTGANTTSALQHRGTGKFFLKTLEAAPITFGTTNAERMRIQSNGNVGIGTDDPDALLHVKSTGNGEIEIERNAGAKINIQAQSARGVIGTDSNHELDLKTNATTRVRILNNGNVGINETAPTQSLSVNGAFSGEYPKDSGLNNVVMGVSNAGSMTSGVENFIVGQGNLTLATSINRSTVSGQDNARAISSSAYDSFFGYGNLYTNTGATSYNFMAGYRNLFYSTGTATDNVMIGRGNGFNATAAASNATLLGRENGYNASSVNTSTMIGWRNCYWNTNVVNQNNIIGYGNMYNVDAAIVYNSVMGYHNAYNATDVDYTSLFGFKNAYNAGNLDYSALIGRDNAYSASAVNYTTMSGYANAMNATSVITDSALFGRQNAENGFDIQYSIISGLYNAREAEYVRNSALLGRENAYVSSSVQNSFMSGYRNAYTTTNNTNYSMLVGYQNGYNAGSLNNTILLGYRQGYSTGSQGAAAYRLAIGMYQDNPLIYGEFDNEVLKVNGNLTVTDRAGTANKLAAFDTSGKLVEADAYTLGYGGLESNLVTISSTAATQIVFANTFGTATNTTAASNTITVLDAGIWDLDISGSIGNYTTSEILEVQIYINGVSDRFIKIKIVDTNSAIGTSYPLNLAANDEITIKLDSTTDASYTYNDMRLILNRIN